MPSLGILLVFLIIFGAFLATDGLQGRRGGNGTTFRAMVQDAPRLAQIQSPTTRGRAATAIVLATYALVASLTTGFLLLIWSVVVQ